MDKVIRVAHLSLVVVIWSRGFRRFHIRAHVFQPGWRRLGTIRNWFGVRVQRGHMEQTGESLEDDREVVWDRCDTSSAMMSNWARYFSETFFGGSSRVNVFCPKNNCHQFEVRDRMKWKFVGP